MLRSRVVKQVAVASLREFVRSKEAVFWTYGFPVLMAVVLGLAFSRDEPDPSRVAVIRSDVSSQLVSALEGVDGLEISEVDESVARQRLEDGRVELVLAGIPARPIYAHAHARPESELAWRRVDDALERRGGRRDVTEKTFEDDPHAAERYIDFLIPGLIGLNLLGAGLFGVGFNLVDMRAKHLLRRLVVAPMSRAEFLLGFMLSRLALVVVDGLLILAFGMLAFGVPMDGSWLLFLLALAIGAMAFSGVGLVVASRPRTVEGVSGLMNLVLVPMWLLCGSFFKTSNFPESFQPIVQALPLTHINQALREICAGHGVAAVWPEFVVLAAFAVVTFGVALRIFRWT